MRRRDSIPDLATARALLRDLPGPDEAAAAACRARDAELTKPAGALGRLEELAVWLSRLAGRAIRRGWSAC